MDAPEIRQVSAHEAEHLRRLRLVDADDGFEHPHRAADVTPEGDERLDVLRQAAATEPAARFEVGQGGRSNPFAVGPDRGEPPVEVHAPLDVGYVDADDGAEIGHLIREADEG